MGARRALPRAARRPGAGGSRRAPRSRASARARARARRCPSPRTRRLKSRSGRATRPSAPRASTMPFSRTRRPKKRTRSTRLGARARDAVEDVAHAEVGDVDALARAAEDLDQLAPRELGVREEDLGRAVGLDHEAPVGGAHQSPRRPAAGALARERHAVGEPGGDVAEAHAAPAQERRQVGGLVEEAQHGVDRSLGEQALDRAAHGAAVQGPVQRMRIDAHDLRRRASASSRSISCPCSSAGSLRPREAACSPRSRRTAR